MQADWTPDEVFEVAKQIEKNGAAFYLNASESVDNPQLKKTFLDLHEAEKKHHLEFFNMQTLLKDDISPDYDPGFLEFVQMTYEEKVFNEIKDYNFTDINIDEVFKLALQGEKNSIVFYESLRRLCNSKEVRAHIQTIIVEEIRHIFTLKKNAILNGVKL